VNQRLTETQQRDLLAMYQAGEPLSDIAERFAVHKSYACHLARRRGVRRVKALKKQVVG
jgi:hypothetical protein